MKRALLLIIIVFSVQNMLGQTAEQKEYVEQVWFGYFNQTRVSIKWGFWFDSHLRTRDNHFDSLSSTIIRPGITYYLNDKLKFTLEYAFVNYYPDDNHPEIPNRYIASGNRFSGIPTTPGSGIIFSSRYP